MSRVCKPLQDRCKAGEEERHGVERLLLVADSHGAEVQGDVKVCGAACAARGLREPRRPLPSVAFVGEHEHDKRFLAHITALTFTILALKLVFARLPCSPGA